MKKHIPNIITSMRILLTIPMMIFFFQGNFPLMLAMVGMSSITDCFDGMIARKLNATSELGAKLDAISDKLFVLVTSIFSIYFCGPVLGLPLLLEGVIGAINVRRYIKKQPVSSKLIGKIKTWFLFGTMFCGLSKSIFKVPDELLLSFVGATTITQLGSIYEYKKEEEKMDHEKTKLQRIREDKNFYQNLKENVGNLNTEEIREKTKIIL